jgi:hypothetical protein
MIRDGTREGLSGTSIVSDRASDAMRRVRLSGKNPTISSLDSIYQVFGLTCGCVSDEIQHSLKSGLFNIATGWR